MKINSKQIKELVKQQLKNPKICKCGELTLKFGLDHIKHYLKENKITKTIRHTETKCELTK